MKSFNGYKIFNESFSVKAFVKITLFIVIISASFTIFFVLQESKSQTDNLIKKGELLAKLLAYNSRLGVFTENENMLKNSAGGFFQYDEVLSVTIFNLEGKLLIKQEIPGREVQEESVETDKNKKNIIEKIKKSGAFFHHESSPDTFEFWAPVITGLTYPAEDALFFDKKLFFEKDRITGFVEVILDKSMLNKQLKALLFKGILMGIIFSMIGAVATYLMVKRITRPLESLSNTSVEIGKGNMDVKVDVTSKDEIGRLAAAFNKMTEDLKEYRRRNELILNSAGEGIFGLDLQGKHTFVNPAAAKMLGYEAEELVGKHSHSTWHHSKPDGSPYQEEECPIYAVYKDGLVHHIRDEVFWRKDGTSFSVAYTSTPIIEDGKIVGAVVTFRDITERKRAEKELLRKKEEKIDFLAEILKTSPVSVITTDQDSKITYVNPATEKLFGYSTAELMGKSPHILNAEPNADEIQKKIVDIVSQEKVWKGELLQKRKNGELFYIHASIYRLLDNKGIFIALVGFQEDITERKQAEEALRQSEGKINAMLRSIGDHMSMMDKDLTIIWANDISKKNFGNDIVGRKCYEVYHRRKEPCEPYPCLTLKAFQDGKIHEHETQVINKDGEIMYFHCISNVALRDKKGKPVAVIEVSRDITERKLVEEKLLAYQDQLRSMASELSLAEERERHRIATELHDHIGQSLAISKIELGALRKALSSSEFSKSINKIHELISQTIQDTRSLIFEISPPILYELGFEAAVEWLAEQIKEQHDILIKFEDDNKPKPLDDNIRVLLFQTVRELLVNVAKHSQARKGKVSLRSDGYNIRIKVEDDGIGFNYSKIYSHMDMNKGFGLFSIRERLNSLGGYLEIVSEPGSGTEVTLVAPLERSKENQKGNIT